MPSSQQPPHNPYANAAGAYAQNAQANSDDPRDLEARVLLRAVAKMQDLQKRWGSFSSEELDDVLRFNRQIWMMFLDTATTTQTDDRPVSLRSNIANLGAYVCKRSLEILADPKKEKLDILIDINREIAAGLMTKPKVEGEAADAKVTQK